MKNTSLFFSVALLVLVGVISQSVFTVHQTQKALVLQLGDPLDTVYGPGLHFKLPFIQNVVFFDARILDYDARSTEAYTVDKKAIVLDNYARWRIADPLQFYRTMRTIPGAQARLDDVVYSQLRALVGGFNLSEVVSSHRAQIMEEVTRKVAELMRPFRTCAAATTAPSRGSCRTGTSTARTRPSRGSTTNFPMTIQSTGFLSNIYQM